MLKNSKIQETKTTFALKTLEEKKKKKSNSLITLPVHLNKVETLR
jgi:hypothetical protein